MFRLIGFVLKISFFAILVLILGNTLRWNGRTISDQVKIEMSHAERSPWLDTARGWASKLTRDAGLGIQKRPNPSFLPGLPSMPKLPNHASIQEEFPSTERQKLKALIQELNTSRE